MDKNSGIRIGTIIGAVVAGCTALVFSLTFLPALTAPPIDEAPYTITINSHTFYADSYEQEDNYIIIDDYWHITGFPSKWSYTDSKPIKTSSYTITERN